MPVDYSTSEMVGRLDRRFGSHVRHQQLWKPVVEPGRGFRRGGRWRIPAANEDCIAEGRSREGARGARGLGTEAGDCLDRPTRDGATVVATVP